MEEKIINIFKGLAWGLVLLIIIATCSGCGSSKTTTSSEIIDLKDINKVSVSSDSTTSIVLNTSNIEENKAVVSQENVYVVEWSAPDALGNQYKTKETYAGKDVLIRTESSRTNSQVKYENRIQKSIDSLRQRLKRIEENKKSAEKTSDSVSILDNIKIILVIVLLIFIVWIIAKRVGFY